uniref:Peptidase S1 domain-containing protein n=1 Tax=Panagrolaimus sp. JU765 TaxID=591449 RepID=A0AC34QGX3_9BILA
MVRIFKLPLLILLVIVSTKSSIRNKRIIGGLPAPIDERYHFAPPLRSIIYKDNGFGQCGSTIIGKRHLLTAAHCIVMFNETSPIPDQHISYLLLKSDEIWIDMRLINSIEDRDPKNYNISARYYFHPSYQRQKFNNDIAIIEFPEDFDFGVEPILLASDFKENAGEMAFSVGYDFDFGVEPILLASDFKENAGEMAFSVGYGKFNENFNESDNLIVARELREGVFVLRDQEFCKQVWAKPDTRKKICAGELGRGTARGDSGGPIMKNGDDGKWYQIGITSYGNRLKKFNRRDYPGISTRISWYCPWIEKVTKNEVKCVKYERDHSPLNYEVIEKIFKINLTEEAQYKFPGSHATKNLCISWILMILAEILLLMKNQSF